MEVAVKNIITLIFALAFLITGCATTGTSTAPQGDASNDGVVTHKLVDKPITKTINIPTVSASGQKLSDKEVLKSVFQLMKQYSSQPPFTSRRASQQHGGYVYHGMYAGMAEDEPGIFELEYHGNTHIKPIGTNRIGKMRVAIPYTISENKVTLTLPTEFQEINQRGFSLFGAKQLDTPENIKRDILQVFNSLQASGVICKVEELEFTVPTDKDLDELLPYIEKTLKTRNCGSRNGEKYCRDVTYIFPSLHPEDYQVCNNSLALRAYDTHVESIVNIHFKRYMAAHNAEVSIYVPYLIKDGEIYGREVVAETKQYFTDLLTK